MKSPKSTKAIIASLVVVFFVVFGLMVRAAGYTRQARFNIDVVGQILSRYHTTYGTYPDRLNELPSFYVLSIFDRLYLDNEVIKKRLWRGYRYDYEKIDKDRFVISASPVGFWPSRVEYAITEKGVLKMNEKLSDANADTYGEIQNWRPIGRLNIRK